jgi:hypothetical protein
MDPSFQMERYFEIRKDILLGFFNGQEQYDVIPEPGQGQLMFNGSDIYWLIEGERRMSDTINEAISIWLRTECIEEVTAPLPDPSADQTP